MSKISTASADLKTVGINGLIAFQANTITYYTNQSVASGILWSTQNLKAGAANPIDPRVSNIRVRFRKMGAFMIYIHQCATTNPLLRAIKPLSNIGACVNQHWTITDVGSGFYKIENVNSTKALSVNENSTNNGANVLQWDYNGWTHQHWSFEEVMPVFILGEKKLTKASQDIFLYSGSRKYSKINLSLQEDFTSLFIYDSQGNTVSLKGENGYYSISSNIPSGVYLIAAYTHKRFLGQKKIVIYK